MTVTTASVVWVLIDNPLLLTVLSFYNYIALFWITIWCSYDLVCNPADMTLDLSPHTSCYSNSCWQLMDERKLNTIKNLNFGHGIHSAHPLCPDISPCPTGLCKIPKTIVANSHHSLKLELTFSCWGRYGRIVSSILGISLSMAVMTHTSSGNISFIKLWAWKIMLANRLLCYAIHHPKTGKLCSEYIHLFNRSQAGRLVGLADCYAVLVLADNATFLLAVNRIAALR